jgi:uncharacterized protein (DUF58 family)
MLKFLNRNSVSFALVAGTLGCLALGSLLIALASRQQGALTGATWWMRTAIVLFILLILYTLPKLAQLVSPEALPFTLPFHVPGLGLAFGAFVAVVALTAFSTGNNLLYLIFSLLLAMMVVSAVAARLNLTRLDLDLSPPKHIFAEEPVTLELTFTNRKRLLPAFSLTVVLKENDAKTEPRELAFVAVVPPRAQARVRSTHTFTQRGVYELQFLQVVTRFPFGLVERSYALDSSGELVVYPHVPALRQFEQSLPFSLGQLESPRKGNGSDLYAIRPYQPADHRHAIDWKATAKTSRLMVREFTREDDWRVTVMFDIQATPDESEKFERAVSLTASLLEHFIAEGAEVRLLIGETDLGYGSSRVHWYAMLRELARLQTPEHTIGEETEELAETPPPALADPVWQAVPATPGSEFCVWLTSAGPDAVPGSLRPATHVIHFADL